MTLDRWYETGKATNHSKKLSPQSLPLIPQLHHSLQKVKPFMSGLTPTAWPSAHFPGPVTVTNHPSLTLRQLTPAQIGLQHHERMDGSGYPNGLSGENILIEARIMGVADVIESMSSHRPYRPAFSIEKALLEIIFKKGVLYDPEVVDACVRLFNEKGFVFD
jgi:hypothetical protein